MWLPKKKTYVFIIVLLCYHGVSCKKSSVKRREKTPSQNEMAGINQQSSTIPPESQDEARTIEESTTEEHTTEHDHKFDHKLETAPLPCMHAGEVPLKPEPKKSAPMALETKFKNITEQSEQKNQDESTTVRHTTEHHAHEHKFEHKLESAPLPCMHQGHTQPLKMEPRSAPMALESKFKDTPEQLEQRDQGNQQSFENSPNPQRPNASKLTSIANDTSSDDGKPRHFNHPGHTQSSNNYPAENYNYYGIHNTYDPGYSYGTQEPSVEDKSTSNVGVIPRKNQNAREYYNKISGYAGTPIIAKQGGLFSQLLPGNKNERLSSIRYGMGGFGFGGNSYRNVLSGLHLWSMMNVYSTLNHNIYHAYNFPQWMVHYLGISYELVIKCADKANLICNGTKPICTNNSVFCVSKDAVLCQNQENTCVETTLPFYDMNVESNGSVKLLLPCIVNITLTSDDRPDNFELSADMLDTPLCVTIVAVPQKPCNTQSVSGDETDCPMTPMATSTTATPLN